MGLCVSNLAASLAFYRDVAGFTVQSGPYHIVGEWFDTLTWNEGADIEVAMLDLDGFTIQLVQYHAAGDAPRRPDTTTSATLTSASTWWMSRRSTRA